MTPERSRRQQLAFENQRKWIALFLTGDLAGKQFKTFLNSFHFMLRDRFPGFTAAPANQQCAFFGLRIPEQITTNKPILTSQPGFPAAAFRVQLGLASLTGNLDAQMLDHGNVVAAIGV